MKTLRKIVVTFIVISMLLASFNFAYAGENKNPSYDIITVPCAGTIINKTTVKLLVNDKKSDSLYISAIDAAKFSGYEVSVSGKKVTFTRSTDTYSTSDFITYCNQNWLPLESTLEKLQTQITLNDNALLFTGKKATVAELYSYIGEYVFGKGAGFNYAGFDVENRVDLDNIGFELFMGKVYDVFVDWKAFDILLGKQDFDVYEKVFHDLLKHEETSKFESFISGAYKEVKSFNKDFIKNGKQTGEDIATLIALTELNTESIASFSDLSKLSDLAAKYDTFEDYIHSSEFLNVIKDYDYEDIEQIWSSDYYEALKKVNYGFGLSDVGKAFSDTFSLVNDPIGQITKDAGFKVKGFDVITMLGLVNNIYDIYHASTTSLNEILATYYDENGKLTGCTPYEAAFLIKLKDYTDQQKGGWGTVGVAAQEAITNALINASVSEIENMVMEDLLGFTATALGKITSKVCTSAMSFILDDDIAAGYGAINKIVPIATIQNTAESQYYTRKIHDDPVGAKYAALLYLDLYLLECKNETSGNFGSEMRTAKAAKGYYDNLALVNDMDLVTVAKNGFTVKKEMLKVLQLEKGVTNLEITALPDKNEYIKDDFIWTEGLELLATYKDGTTEKVIRGYTYDPNISASSNEQKVTVTFRDATVDYMINSKNTSITTPSDNPNDNNKSSGRSYTYYYYAWGYAGNIGSFNEYASFDEYNYSETENAEWDKICQSKRKITVKDGYPVKVEVYERTDSGSLELEWTVTCKYDKENRITESRVVYNAPGDLTELDSYDYKNGKVYDTYSIVQGKDKWLVAETEYSSMEVEFETQKDYPYFFDYGDYILKFYDENGKVYEIHYSYKNEEGHSILKIESYDESGNLTDTVIYE